MPKAYFNSLRDGSLSVAVGDEVRASLLEMPVPVVTVSQDEIVAELSLARQELSRIRLGAELMLETQLPVSGS